MKPHWTNCGVARVSICKRSQFCAQVNSNVHLPQICIDTFPAIPPLIKLFIWLRFAKKSLMISQSVCLFDFQTSACKIAAVPICLPLINLELFSGFGSNGNQQQKWFRFALKSPRLNLREFFVCNSSGGAVKWWSPKVDQSDVKLDTILWL